MLIANQKRKENIAEYLLYLWQVEDMLRACNLDMALVDERLVGRFDVDEATRHEVHEWYESLVLMMQHEQLKQGGHLQISKNVLIRLHDLHAQLLADDKYADYAAEFYRTLPFIVELRATLPAEQREGELETCFNALYGVLLLRLQGKEITPATALAIKQIGHFVGLLAAYFKKDEDQPLFGNDDITP